MADARLTERLERPERGASRQGLLRGSDHAVRVAVLQRHVFLVGFMGAGKTSVARRLARMCQAASIDSDVYIARRIDLNTTEFIERYGVDEFREQETAALRDIVKMPPSFIALGGGIVEREENRALIKANGFTVYLDVTAENAAGRISNLDTRPLFGDLAAAEQLNERRRPLYEEVADVRVETLDRRVGQLAQEVHGHLVRLGALVEGK